MFLSDLTTLEHENEQAASCLKTRHVFVDRGGTSRFKDQRNDEGVPQETI